MKKKEEVFFGYFSIIRLVSSELVFNIMQLHPKPRKGGGIQLKAILTLKPFPFFKLSFYFLFIR